MNRVLCGKRHMLSLLVPSPELWNDHKYNRPSGKLGNRHLHDCYPLNPLKLQHARTEHAEEGRYEFIGEKLLCEDIISLV